MPSNSSSSDIDDPLFTSGHRIFKNKDLLKIGHVPEADRIVGRDEEIKSMGSVLAPPIRGGPPETMIVYGKIGTGKSLVTRCVSREATRRAAANRSRPITLRKRTSTRLSTMPRETASRSS